MSCQGDADVWEPQSDGPVWIQLLWDQPKPSPGGSKTIGMTVFFFNS